MKDEEDSGEDESGEEEEEDGFRKSYQYDENRQVNRGSAPTLTISIEQEEVEEEEEEEDERGETKANTVEPNTIDNSHIQKGEAFYACSICNKLFTYRSLWSRHEKEHYTSKNFICNFCGTKFTRQFYLVRHRRVCVAAREAGEKMPPSTNTGNGKPGSTIGLVLR
eukprot:sb/3472486/